MQIPRWNYQNHCFDKPSDYILTHETHCFTSGERERENDQESMLQSKFE